MTNKKVYGIGINDIIGGHILESYPAWASMLNRCYSRHDKYPTYIGCSVAQEWHTLSEFHKWYIHNYVPGYQLDKDLLMLGNKVYGPDTCIFVPAWVNTFVIDSAAIRGKYPIGVSKHGDKFRASIRENGQKKHLGVYTTPEQAHQAWLTAKRQQVINRRDELDQIDPRLYPALLARYTDNVVPIHQHRDLTWLENYTEAA